jgi:ribosomal protein S15P/S13E
LLVVLVVVVLVVMVLRAVQVTHHLQAHHKATTVERRLHQIL